MADEFDDQIHDRRAVFLKGLGRLMRPLAQFIEQRIPDVILALPVTRTVLRPPGALPERQFLETCYRCGNCMDVCPARCIRPGAAVGVRPVPSCRVICLLTLPSEGECILCLVLWVRS